MLYPETKKSKWFAHRSYVDALGFCLQNDITVITIVHNDFLINSL